MRCCHNGRVTVAPDTTNMKAHGLSTAEVAERVAAGKVNVVEETTSRPLKLIITSNVFTRFNAILGTLAVLVLVTGSWKDATFGLLMVVNALIGIVQELRAKKKLDSLAVLNAPLARVRPDPRCHRLQRHRTVEGFHHHLWIIRWSCRMTYALIENGVATKYPYSFDRLRADNKNVSFPASPSLPPCRPNPCRTSRPRSPPVAHSVGPLRYQ